MSEKPVELDVNLVAQQLAIVLHHFVSAGHKFVDLRHRYYWSISDSEKYNVSEKPHDLAIGDLEFDAEMLLHKVTSGDVVASDLRYAVEILRAIAIVGEQNGI